MKIKNYLFEIIYSIFYFLTMLSLGKVLKNYQSEVAKIEGIVLQTIGPVITITIFTVTIVLILFRLSHISKYNVPQVVIMKIKYYRLMIVTAITFVVIVLMIILILYIGAGYVSNIVSWIFLTVLELALITFIFLLVYLLIVSIILMYQLKAGGDGYSILFESAISKKDFLTVIMSVEGDISKHHAKELVYNILNAEHNKKLKKQVLTQIDYKTIAKIYNFEVKYQLLKFWLSEEKLASIINKLRSGTLNYRKIKNVLDEYEDLIVEFICEDIKKTKIYKYKKNYLFEKLITEIFILTENNLDEYENFRTYVYICEYMDNVVYRIIERCSDNKSELIKYYVDYLITAKESFTEDIWFDIICDKLLTCENNSKIDNVILLKCLLASCNKYSELYFSKEKIGYFTNLLNMNNTVSIKYENKTKIYFDNNSIININAIEKLIANDLEYLKDVSTTDFCNSILIRRGYKDITGISNIFNIETKHSVRIYDLLLEANDKLTKNLENSESEFVVIDSLYTTSIGKVYLEKIDLEINLHKTIIKKLNVSSVYRSVEFQIKKINSRYYRCIKLITAYARINIDTSNSKKSLGYLEMLKNEETSTILDTLLKIFSQISQNSKFNLLNPMLFIYINFLYYTNFDTDIELKYENIKGISEILDILKNSVFKKSVDLNLSQASVDVLTKLVHGDKKYSPYINYKHIISSIESEEFRKRTYVIYGIEFSELTSQDLYRNLCNYLSICKL